MNKRTLFAGLLLSASVGAATPADFASQWPLLTDKEGAWAVTLDTGIYQQVTHEDLSDLAAFNADGEELAFGPLPAANSPPSRKWHDAVWFAMPGQATEAVGEGDLHLHVTRSAEGSLALDTTLSGVAPVAASSSAVAPVASSSTSPPAAVGSATPSAAGTGSSVSTAPTSATDILVDVRAKDRLIEALAFDFADAAPDFSAEVEVDASDDLQHWRTLATDAPLAQFGQRGQHLLRRTVEFPAQAMTYLRVHASEPLPVLAVHQLQRDQGSEPARISLEATPAGRDGNAFIYRLPARVDVERLSIALADDNAIAHFAVSAREEGETDWHPIGGYTAFRLRGTGLILDAEPIDIDAGRMREWRIVPDSTVATTPRLRFDYRPETWVVLTHGRFPYVIVAGSRRAHRGEFPVDALIGPLRARYGAQWQPQNVGHGGMQASAGEAALHGWDAAQGRTWLLWAILVLGAGVVAIMVIGLLRSPPKPEE